MLVVAAGRALLAVLLWLRTWLLHLLRMKLLTRRLLSLRLRTRLRMWLLRLLRMKLLTRRLLSLRLRLRTRLRTRLLRLLRMKLLTRRLLNLRLRTWFRTRLLLDLRPLDRFGVLRMLLLPHRRIFHGARRLA